MSHLLRAPPAQLRPATSTEVNLRELERGTVSPGTFLAVDGTAARQVDDITDQVSPPVIVEDDDLTVLRLPQEAQPGLPVNVPVPLSRLKIFRVLGHRLLARMSSHELINFTKRIDQWSMIARRRINRSTTISSTC